MIRISMLAMASLLLAGCSSESERLANLAEQTIAAQNEVNSAVSQTNKNLASLNREVQAERNALTDQRRSLQLDLQYLERQRQQVQQQSRRELAWAEWLRLLAVLIAATAPLIFCAFLVWALHINGSNQEGINDLLIDQVRSYHARVTGPAPAAHPTQHQPKRLEPPRSKQKSKRNRRKRNVTRRRNRDSSSRR